MKVLVLAVLLTGLVWGQSAVVTSRKAASDVELTADPASSFWRQAPAIVAENDYNGNRVPNHRMEVRSRWTANHLYLLFICQYEALNLKPNPTTTAETQQLWNWDVAETFIGSDFADIARYKEFQVSPQSEWVDLDIDRSAQKRGAGSAWNSGFKVKARVDAANKTWYGEMQIPFQALGGAPPAAGRELRAGFFRIAGTAPDKKHVSWQPTGGRTFHVPEKFGILRLTE
jgi:cellulose/xylan binding protein with CBM9 domain